MTFDQAQEVKKAVDHATDLSNGSDDAYKNLQADIAGVATAGIAKGTPEYQAYVGQVAKELEDKGALPNLALAWTKEQVAGKEGVTKAELESKAASVDKDTPLDSAIAKVVAPGYEQLKAMNIDTDAGGNEKDMITNADLVQAGREQGKAQRSQADLDSCNTEKAGLQGKLSSTEQERDTLKQEGDTVKQERDSAKQERDSAKQEQERLSKVTEKEDGLRKEEARQAITAGEASRSKMGVNPGDGYWNVAKRALEADGSRHKNSEVAALMQHLQELNGHKPLKVGGSVIIRSEADEKAAVEKKMADYDAKEADRRKQALEGN